MKLTKALSLRIAELNQPVVTLYQIAIYAYDLYLAKSFKGEAIRSIQKEFLDSSALNSALSNLIEGGILAPYRGFPRRSVFSVFGKSGDAPDEVACSVDPFCYVSHLSAMEHHGLTNRFPSTLFISSPGRGAWTRFARDRMKKDLAGNVDKYTNSGLPVLTKTKMEKIGKTPVHRHNSLHHGAYKNVKGKCLRISTIGRTFLDMLKNPDLCGGMAHVLDVYAEHAETYLRLIVDEVTSHGGPIDKVRAGYILDERLGLKDPIIDVWVSHAQRGGSRKLDATAEYVPEYSEKWCLSINLF